MKRLAPVVLALTLVACGTVGSAGGAPAVDPVTVAPTATPSPVPTASPSPSPSAKPTPVISAKGAITLASPAVNARLQSPVIISGEASVFEAALQWRISDTGGRVIAEGQLTASQGAPGRGTYSVTVPYTVTSETVAFIEVYSRSPKDGNIDDLVRVPVTLR